MSTETFWRLCVRAPQLREPRRLLLRTALPRARLRRAPRGGGVAPRDGRDQRRPGPVLGGAQLLDRAVHAAGHGRLPAVGAEGRAAVGEQEPQRVVDLGLRPDRRARVAHAVLLLERDRGRHGLDRVHVRSAQPLQELARVGRERLRVPPLPLRVERVEGEGRLAGPGDAGDHGQAGQRDRDRDVLEVVGPGSLDADDRRAMGSLAGDLAQTAEIIRRGGVVDATSRGRLIALRAAGRSAWARFPR